MQIGPQKSKKWFKNGVYLGLTIFLGFMGLGCASTHKTTKTETTVTSSDESGANEGEQKTTTSVSTSDDQENRGGEKSETTTTTTETKTDHPGILSSTFHAIGYIIALPFIVIGGLFRMIFGG